MKKRLETMGDRRSYWRELDRCQVTTCFIAHILGCLFLKYVFLDLSLDMCEDLTTSPWYTVPYEVPPDGGI